MVSIYRVACWIGHFKCAVLNASLKKQLAYCGSGVLLGKSISFVNPENISIGDRTFIGDNVLLNGLGELNIGSDCAIGAGSKFISFSHSWDKFGYRKDSDIKLQTVIGERVWIGYNVIVLPGVKVGARSIVGAGSIVTKDVPAGSVVAGNPARFINTVDTNFHTAKGFEN